MNEKLPYSYSTRRKKRRITQLYVKQKGRCIYCKKDMWLPWNPENIFEIAIIRSDFKSRATLEHKKAISNGGSKKKFHNLACSCLECNGRKGSLPHILFTIIHKSKTLYVLGRDFIRYIKKPT